VGDGFIHLLAVNQLVNIFEVFAERYVGHGSHTLVLDTFILYEVCYDLKDFATMVRRGYTRKFAQIFTGAFG